MSDCILLFVSPPSPFIRDLISSFGEFFPDTDIVCYIVGKREERYESLRDRGVIDELVVDADVVGESGRVPDYNYLRDAENCFGPLWECLFGDRHIAKESSQGLFHLLESPYTHDELLNHLEDRLRAIESLTEQHEFKFVYGQNIGRLPISVGYKIARAREIRFFRAATTRVDNYFRVHETVHEHSEQVEAAVKAAKREPEEFPLAEASEYVRRVRSGGSLYDISPPGDAGENGQTWPAYVEMLRNTLGELKAILFHTEEYFNAEYYYNVPRSKRRYYIVKKVIRQYWQTYTDIFDEFNPNRPYVYVPLQVQPEQSLMVWARYFTEFPALIYNVAQSVPAGIEVYVNEHPNMFGARPTEFYDRCRRLPNVRVFGPDMETDELIRSADCVLTVTSSVGLQSLVHGTPTVTFGEPSYSILGTVDRVREFDTLYETVRSAVTGDVDDQEVLTYIAANMHVGYSRDSEDFTDYVCAYIHNSLTLGWDEAWRETSRFPASHQ